MNPHRAFFPHVRACYSYSAVVGWRIQAIDATVTSPRIAPGSRKYPAKYNRMLAALVEFLELQRREGAFDREYISVSSSSNTSASV